MKTIAASLLVLSFVCASASAGVVHLGSLARFSGAADLDFTGSFTYAVNVGGTATPTIGGASFTIDSVTGCSVTAANVSPAWASKPELGSSPDDDAVEAVLYPIRWTQAPGVVSVALDVTAGRTYKLQSLFSENYWSGSARRYFDILVERALCVDEMDIQAVTGQTSQPQNHGAVHTYTLVAPDGTLNIVMGPGSTTGDNNPILNAFTLEDVTPPPPSNPIPEPLAAAVMLLGGPMLHRRRRE